MQYALLGDIHSSKEDLEAVLHQIENEYPEAVLTGTGDLYECTVSKKKLHGQIYPSVDQVIRHPEGFDRLLTFPSVYGNQEERILLLTDQPEPLRDFLSGLPEMIEVENALIIHGHQWQGSSDPWSYAELPEVSVLFHGHTHRSGLICDGQEVKVDFDQEISVLDNRTIVNVGAVIGNREWVLYDSEQATVRFKKV